MAFDVAYPERLSRLLIFVKLLLAIPHFVVLIVLSLVWYLLTFITWFAILFTGRYPKAFFDFNSGVLQWSARVTAYIYLLRDEYPPFSLEHSDYPVSLLIPYPERQSRGRLFIRMFSIIPSWFVLYFLQLAAYFTTFISWFAILFTGRYPKGLFDFSVGVQRWQHRLYAYGALLRDEYPPYSISADARPGNEVVSTIIGVPMLAAYLALNFLPLFAFVALGGGSTTVEVSRGALEAPGGIAAEEPSAHSGSLRITLLDYDDDAPSRGVTVGRGNRLVSFDVLVEKDGFWPTFYAPFLFFLDDCLPRRASEEEFDSNYGINTDATDIDFDVFWRGGSEEDTIFFEIPDFATPCQLSYFAGRGFIEFEFE